MSVKAQLIQTGDLGGPLNMAIDELLWVEAARGPIYLRLYGWADRPALSLGYFQSAAEVRRDPRWSRLPYVRRITGGGTIIHDQEVTYSLALPSRIAPRTSELYDRVHRSIAETLVESGIPAQVGASELAHDDAHSLCFHRSDRFAVRVHGVKVLGSAQRRRTDSVLVHGSLLLASSVVAPEIAGLREALGTEVGRELAERLMVRAMQSSLSLDLTPCKLVGELWDRAVQLADEKYRSPRWNNLRQEVRTRTYSREVSPSEGVEAVKRGC